MRKASEGEAMPGAKASVVTQTTADTSKEESEPEPASLHGKIAAVRKKAVAGLFLLAAVPVGLLIVAILLDVVILPAGRFLKEVALGSYPLNLWFVGAAIAWVILAGTPSRDRWWAKFLRAPLEPAIFGLGLLMFFVGALWELRGDAANLFATWEDVIVLTLNGWLSKHPSTWEYVIVLSLATLVSWRAPRSKAVTRVKSVKKWQGTVAGIVAVMANVTFLGEQQVVKVRFPEVMRSLRARYVKAEEQKRDHLQLEFATRATTEMVKDAGRDGRQTLKNYLAALAALDLPESFQDRVGDRFLSEAETPANQSDASRARKELETKWKAQAAKLEPEKIVAAVNHEAAQDQLARQQTDEATEGLKTALKQIVGSQNGKLVDLSMKFLDPLVQRIGEHAGLFLDPILDSLQDQAKDSVKDLIKEYEGKFVDRELARLNHQPAPGIGHEQARTNLMARAVEIANSDLKDFARRSGEIIVGARFARTSDQLSDVNREAADARREKEDAQKVLKTCSGTVKLQGAQIQANFDDAALKDAERSLRQIESERAQAERRVSSAKLQSEKEMPEGPR